MRLGIGIHGRRRSTICCRVLGGGIAFDALVSSSAAAAATGAAPKAAARALGAAAYASRYAGNHGYDNEGADDDNDYDRPFAVGLGHTVVPRTERVARLIQRVLARKQRVRQQ